MHRMQQCRVQMAGSKMRPSLPRSPRTQTIVFVVTLAFFVVSPLAVSISRQNRPHEVSPIFLENPIPTSNGDAPRDVRALLAKLVAATRRAESSGDRISSNSTSLDVFTPAKKALWHKQHPCASRDEIYDLFSSSRRIAHDNVDSGSEINPKWNSVFREYANLHRTCVSRMGDSTDFFLKRKHIDGCQFVVAGVSAGSGVGNKALSIVSALLYAVLTQRVLLVPHVSGVPGVFCEPFEGSSWMVDPNQIWAESKKSQDLWDSLQLFYKRVDARSDAHATIQPIYAVSTTEHWDAQPEPRFFCDTEQAHYARSVDWINFRNNFYFVPKLFAVGSFRHVLEDLFPTRKVVTTLLRTLMLPSDVVWERVKTTHDAHLRHSDHRIGIQERYFHGKSDFNLLHTSTEENIIHCLISQNLFPNPITISESPSSVTSSPRRNVTTIFIASLYQSLSKRLSSGYVQAHHQVQLSHEGTQRFGVEVDRQALLEILCLSLTDELIITPLSTFGALAQGYGGLVPWFIDLRPDTATPCVRALSSETCFQLPATKLYTCPHDVSVNGQFMTHVVPYLSDCHSVEKPFAKVNGVDLGMQLIPTM